MLLQQRFTPADPLCQTPQVQLQFPEQDDRVPGEWWPLLSVRCISDVSSHLFTSVTSVFLTGCEVIEELSCTYLLITHFVVAIYLGVQV